MNFFDIDQSSERTLSYEGILEKLNQENKRICFGQYDKQKPKEHETKKPYYGAINLPFTNEGFDGIFPADLFPNKQDEHNNRSVWRSIKTEEEFNEITQWCEDRKDYVYLNGCFLTIALGMYIQHKEASSLTELGEIIRQTKERKCPISLKKIEKRIDTFFDKHPEYKNVDGICAVPGNKNKPYHLPNDLANYIAKQLNKPNYTNHLHLARQKESIKEVTKDKGFLKQKLDIWKNAAPTYGGPSLENKRLLLVDDNYQSGASIHYVAMVLCGHGVCSIYGLCMTKTARDTAND
ncbi:MAG: hypothetical protein AAF442_08595 [Pseudomonadota bacterium]